MDALADPFKEAEGAQAARSDRVIQGLGTDEAAWLQWLGQQALPATTEAELVPAGHRMVVVAPHPDDEVLAVGGMLAQLAHLARSAPEECKNRDLLLVAVTDGTASHAGSSIWTPGRLAQERPLESELAWERLGLRSPESRRLAFPDGGLLRLRGALAERIAALLRPGDVVFTTWRLDGHPDHEATGQACAAATACMGARLVEVPVWAWHWAQPGDARMPWRRARRIALDADTVQRKRDAMQAFTSQLGPDASTGAGPILRSTTIERASRPFEVVFA